jgi:serine/threonine-protein kinase
MERLTGTTLADELRAGALGETRACVLTLEVLAAIDTAHALGVLHRDIKPGNILRGTDGRAMVTDFGIAKIAEDDSATTTGLLVGTAAYLAPERLGGELATPVSDVYSVGVVLYEALAGRPPFRADTPLGLVRSIASDDPPPLAALRPDIRPEVVAVVECAMARAAERRYASAAAMSAALAQAADPRRAADTQPTVPIAAPAPTRATSDRPASTAVMISAPPPEQRTRRGAARRVVPWVVLTVAAVLLLAFLLIVAWRDDGDQAPPPTTVPDVVAPSTAIPAPMQRAIDELARAVQR